MPKPFKLTKNSAGKFIDQDGSEFPGKVPRDLDVNDEYPQYVAHEAKTKTMRVVEKYTSPEGLLIVRSLSVEGGGG